ncbi:hypothetical protein [Pseudanabaena sp. ABRG5-3]|uniref:hypothetical protein n=1 Tax=Pseudanabaena sp. ABRG5-3 TaxID=685565 RepID=UPI000F816E5E|nr:hypothetical protein [Pseudanabaena sp. ABRG5-3]
MLNRFLLVLLLTCQLICLGLLWISCFPGLILSSLFMILAIVYVCAILFVVLLIIGIVVIVRLRNREKFLPAHLAHQTKRDRRKLLLTFAITIGLTAILLKTNLPQTVTFALSRPAFEAVIADADKLKSICNSKPTEQQLGFYKVIECDRDSRGGIYFSTGQYGFLFDSFYFGFVYQPNPYGSQHFGTKVYEYPIIGDWHEFKAGNSF